MMPQEIGPRELGSHYRGVKARLNRGRPVVRIPIGCFDQPIPVRITRTDGKIPVVSHVDIVRAIEVDNIDLYERPPISIAEIVMVAARHFGVSPREIYGERRHAHLIKPRHIAMYLACELLTQSLPAIGRAFRRDHTTILTARNKIGSVIQTDAAAKECVENLKRQIIEGRA